MNDAIQHDLEALRALAPLHLPFGLGVLREMRRVAPEVPNIACFDTAFHATQPELATRLPLPRTYFDKGYRRYGFHGLNYEHVVEALPQLTGKPLPRRLLAAHLGSGASMCAIFDGKSVATTMGFSTADGLVMGTRTGSIDPGVLVALMRDEHLSLDQLEDLLYRRSGLLGLSGISPDMRVLLASDRTEAARRWTIIAIPPRAMQPRWCRHWAALDAIVFTGGVGENAGARAGAHPLASQVAGRADGECLCRSRQRGTDHRAARAGAGLRQCIASSSEPVATMSSTVAPRDRSDTGFAKPCSTGPMAWRRARYCVSL